jgi:DNA-binding transcriptional LysR family regulator
VDEAVTDIVEAGYDVGIRLGEFIAADMVAVRLSDEQRQIAVASPAYLKQYGRPDTPADLLHHRCINWRQPGASGCYSWEFLTNGRWSSVAVKGPLIVSHRELAVSAAVQGVGIAFWAEERLHPLIAEGKLVPLLEDWCGSFPGWFAYYPRQRSMPLSVRAFVDSLRRDDSKV